MSDTQREVMERMNAGWTATVYYDDPRARLYPPDGHPSGCERVRRDTIHALFSSGAIRIKDTSKYHVTYEVAKGY